MLLGNTQTADDNADKKAKKKKTNEPKKAQGKPVKKGANKK